MAVYDIAWHSMKDVPTSLPKGIVTKRISTKQIPNDNLSINDLVFYYPMVTYRLPEVLRKTSAMV